MLSVKQPIAVFDSGLGGLTVVRALRRRLGDEDIVYFGDTARVPYGIKTGETVLRFAREACGLLLRLNPKCIVVACNTVSAVALPALSRELPVPVVGVVEPGAAAAVAAAGSGGGRKLIGVLATEATVASNAYRAAIGRLSPGQPVVQVACPLLVPVVEEGLGADDAIVGAVIERYLAPLKRLQPGVCVLGCTHYSMLASAVGGYVGAGCALVDSAWSASAAVVRLLEGSGSLSGSGARGSLHCYVSDNPGRFQSVGSRFLGETIHDCVRVCPEEFAGASADCPPLGRARRASA